MSGWWRWDVGSANPFVGFSTKWIEPIIQRAVDVSHRAEPDVLYTLAYLACMGSAYLFHTPFRAHSTAATDTYGRVTKVFQTWSTIVFFFLHLGPQFVREKKQQLDNAHAKEDPVPVLFFPLFILFTLCFGFLHKMKRRWGLGLTYGGRPSVIVLNSIMLAALGTMHYAYCYTLHKTARNYVWRAILYSLTPASLAVQPLRCLFKLLFLSMCFVMGDYQYKKWRNLDPARGILWAELYEVNKELRQLQGSAEPNEKEKRRDWREAVAPPRVYAADTPSLPPSAAQMPISAVEGRGASDATRSQGLQLPLSNTMGPATSNRDSTVTRPLPISRTLYHEVPPDVPSAQLASQYAADDADLRRVLGSNSSPARSSPTNASLFTDLASPDSLWSTGQGKTQPHRIDRSDPTLSHVVSFRAPPRWGKEVAKAVHPLNRPGMVPWWSTFVLFTAWQTLAGATLRFLAFDVRTIQGFTTPKIFHLHFATSLKDTVRAATAAAFHPATAAGGQPASDASVSILCNSTNDSATVSGGHSHRVEELYRSSEADDTLREGGTASFAAPQPPSRKEPDVWFDWIADVGDGFNPTYAMARLLAQPTLRLSSATARRAEQRRQRGALNVSTDAHGSHGHRMMKAAAAAATCSVSAPTSPLTRATTGVALEEMELLPHSDATTTRGAIPSTDTRVAKARTTSLMDPLSLSKEVLTGEPAEGRNTPASGEGSRGVAVDSFAAAIFPNAHRRTASENNEYARLGTRAPHHLQKDGLITLPRGSFVVIGGDLAYPSPDDETYTTRLFEPYQDAMSANVRLQNLFHAEQQHVVVADANDADVAHVHLLDAATVSGMATGRAALCSGRATAEEALRSVPLLFAIPGNHDWFDGLATFRKYILERTWIGGWLMPQRSSFFVLRLPHNWFMLCGDTGNVQDIDVAQRNYFLDAIEKYMDAESCVILAAHEPGWVYEAMEKDEKPRQPELNRVVEVLGTRLRLRLAGDIHHYSRHVPVSASSESATLVVSGGGGAFLHGARDDSIIAQGTKYVRACAFPDRNTFMSMASRLWGFRVINWKFDLVVGFLCFVLLLSVLPLPMEQPRGMGDSEDGIARSMRLAQVFSLWVGYTTDIMRHVVTRGFVSPFSLAFFWMCFSSAGADRHAPLLWRVLYGGGWAFAVLLSCCGAMAFLHVQLMYLVNHELLRSSDGHWGSELEHQVTLMFTAAIDRVSSLLGQEMAPLLPYAIRLQMMADVVLPTRWLLVLLRSFDPFEALVYLSMKVSGGEMARFAPDATRLQILLYYLYVLFFYWVLITPLVSVLIGTFLLFSVTTFDYMYDGTYSAFQLEEYKHFLRFRLDAETRELQAYVVAVKQPAKVYELDHGFLWSLTGPGLEEHRPPHLKQNPSRWRPVQGNEKKQSRPMTEILEQFTIRPHRVPQRVPRPLADG